MANVAIQPSSCQPAQRAAGYADKGEFQLSKPSNGLYQRGQSAVGNGTDLRQIKDDATNAAIQSRLTGWADSIQAI
jgi:hypothetical protein